jgi:hypothetical protein
MATESTEGHGKTLQLLEIFPWIPWPLMKTDTLPLTSQYPLFSN